MEHRLRESDGFSRIFSLIADAKLILVMGKRVKSFTEFHSVSQCWTQSFTVFETVAPEARNVGSFRHSEMLVAPEARPAECGGAKH